MSVSAPCPKRWAITISRTSPSTREARMAVIITPVALATCFWDLFMTGPDWASSLVGAAGVLPSPSGFCSSLPAWAVVGLGRFILRYVIRKQKAEGRRQSLGQEQVPRHLVRRQQLGDHLDFAPTLIHTQ